MVIMTYGVEGSHRNGAGESTTVRVVKAFAKAFARLLQLGRGPGLARQGLIPLTAKAQKPLSSGAEAGEWGWLISSGQPTARTLRAPEQKQTPCQRALISELWLHAIRPSSLLHRYTHPSPHLVVLYPAVSWKLPRPIADVANSLHYLGETEPGGSCASFGTETAAPPRNTKSVARSCGSTRLYISFTQIIPAVTPFTPGMCMSL